MGCCESSLHSYTPLFWKAKIASATGNVHVVKKYFKKNKNSVLIHWLFETAVENKQEQVINFFLVNNVIQGRYTDYSLRYLTKKGHSEREQILSTRLATKEDLNKMNEYLFSDVNITSAYNFNLMKTLILEANYNCHSYNDFVFRQACEIQDLDMIQFILFLGKGPTNTHIFEDIFYCMCILGHAEVIRLLLTVKQNRGFLNLNFGLVLAVKNRREAVARLLLQNKARFGSLSAFYRKDKTFICYLQTPRRLEAANKIRNWWIPICYDMKRECGKRMFERNFKKYEESIV